MKYAENKYKAEQFAKTYKKFAKLLIIRTQDMEKDEKSKKVI